MRVMFLKIGVVFYKGYLSPDLQPTVAVRINQKRMPIDCYLSPDLQPTVAVRINQKCMGIAKVHNWLLTPRSYQGDCGAFVLFLWLFYIPRGIKFPF